jgi:type IV pilus assembly protein PilV
MITSSNRSRQAGLTLIEILIAVLIISIGLLGVAGLQAFSLRNNHDALMRSHASALAADIADRMRANRADALAQRYDTTFGATRAVTGSPPPLADFDVNEWLNTLAAQLPSGLGQVDVDPATNIALISIRWGESDGTSDFQTETEI